MAHHGTTRQESYQFGYSAVGDDELQEEHNRIPCNHPRFIFKATKTYARWSFAAFIWACIVGLLACIVASVAVTIVFILKTKDIQVDSNSSEYALYKNTPFKECYNAQPAVNCTAVEIISKRHGFPNFRKNGVNTLVSMEWMDTSTWPNSTQGNNPVSYVQWCDIISCFGDWKVVPSTPRPSAFLTPSFASWAAVSVTFLTTMWQMFKRHRGFRHEEELPCKGIEWDDWIIHAYDCGSIVWWWVEFVRWVIAPGYRLVPSVLGWIIPWKYASSLRYHPYTCVFRDWPRSRIAARVVLYMLALAQWAVSLQHWARTWINYSSIYPAYDCNTADIQSAPGTSTCSAEEICAKEWLFISPFFWLRSQIMANFVVGIAPWLTCSAAAMILPGFVAGYLVWKLIRGDLRAHKRGFRGFRERIDSFDFGFPGFLAVLSVVVVIYGAVLIANALKSLQDGSEGTVSFNWKCRAVHVHVSPWRDYWDVDHGWAVRLTRMWFNA